MKAFVGLVLLLSCLAVTQAHHGSHKHKEKLGRRSDVIKIEKWPEDNIDIFSPPRPPPGLRPTGFEVVPDESSAPPGLPATKPMRPVKPELPVLTGLPRPDEQPKKILVEPALTGLPDPPVDLPGPTEPLYIGPPPRPLLPLLPPDSDGPHILPYPGPIPEPLPPFPEPIPEPLPTFPRPFPEPLPPQPFSNCKEGPRLYGMRQIDAGFGMVVATTNQNRAYFLSGQSWYSLGSYRSTFRHVSVGPAGIWAVDLRNRVHNYVAGDFRSSSGVSMMQVDAGGDGQVIGVSSSNFRTQCLRSYPTMVYSRVRTSTLSALSMSTNSMRYLSCGPYSCWGVDVRSRVYVSKKIGPRNCPSGAWIHVPGISARMIEVGTDGSIYTLATNGVVYQRTGAYRGRPQGQSWIKFPMCMPVQHMTYDLGLLWVVTNSGLLLQCSRPNEPVYRPYTEEFKERVPKIE